MRKTQINIAWQKSLFLAAVMAGIFSAIIIYFFIGQGLFAYSEPATDPPDGNVVGPLRVDGSNPLWSGPSLRVLQGPNDEDKPLLMGRTFTAPYDTHFYMNEGASFFLRNTASSPTVAMSVSDTGQVGIRTANPQQALHVVGQPGQATAIRLDSVSGAGGPSSNSTNFRLPLSGTSTGSGMPWVNPENIGQQGTLTTAAVSPVPGPNNNTEYLRATNFGFSLPSNATITGIEVVIRAAAAGGVAGGDVQDDQVRLIRNGALQNHIKTIPGPWPSSLTNRQYGGSGDTWNRTWSPGEINSSNFGVALRANVHEGEAQVETIEIRIYYTTPTTEGSSTSWISGINSDGRYMISPGSGFGSSGVLINDGGRVSLGSGLVNPGANTLLVRDGTPMITLWRTDVGASWDAWQILVPANNNLLVGGAEGLRLIRSGSRAMFRGPAISASGTISNGLVRCNSINYVNDTEFTCVAPSVRLISSNGTVSVWNAGLRNSDPPGSGRDMITRQAVCLALGGNNEVGAQHSGPSSASLSVAWYGPLGEPPTTWFTQSASTGVYTYQWIRCAF